MTVDQDEIDYSDIEAKYAQKELSEDPLQTVLIVDNIPMVDQSREAKLISVLTKLFNSKFGKLKPDGLIMPMSTDGDKPKSKGFAFLDFVSAEEANAALKLADGHRLDAKHTFTVVKFTDYLEIMQSPDTYEEPVKEEYVEREQLNSWLLDTQARDQMCVYAGEEITINWNVGFSRGGEPEVVHQRSNWTDSYVQWSPIGNYLVTVHKQGVALWAGSSWERIARFGHADVDRIEFSANETYLITQSPQSSPGKEDNLRIWDVKSGKLLRSFGAAVYKFSPSEKYVAQGTKEGLNIYELPSLQLLDGKQYKQDGIVDFCWRPYGKEDMLAFWVPEAQNNPARVSIIDAKTKAVVRTKNLFLVSSVKLHWQDQGDFLAIEVERHTKTKKSTFVNIEVVFMNEKSYPIDVYEDIKERHVIQIAWEPFGDKLAILYGDSAKTFLGLYQADKSVVKTLVVAEQSKPNVLKWSPKGRMLVVAQIKNGVGDMDIYDTEEIPLNPIGTVEGFQGTEIDFDPTGRFISSCTSFWKQQSDNGYTIFDFKGTELVKKQLPRLKQFSWRPRPATLLSQDQMKTIRKQLNMYSVKFEEADKKLQSGMSTRARQHRATQRNEWIQWRQKCLEVFNAQAKERSALMPDDELTEVTEVVEEVILE